MFGVARLVFLFALISVATGANAAEIYILGDSIGEGVALAAHARGIAHQSVHIRGRGPLDQIARTPAGSTAFLALGSNDADGPTADLGKHIDNIVQAAARKNIKLVWIGPHCVRRRWDAKARELDAYLNNELSARNVAYVSMRDPEICSGRFYTGDGVHLTMQGYSLIWEKARAVAGLPDAREPKSSTLASVAQPPEKAEGEKPHKKKHAEKAEDDEPKKHRMKPAAERRRRERSFFSLFD